MRVCVFVYESWLKNSKLTKIVSWIATKWILFNIVPLVVLTCFSIGVSMLGSHWSKKSLTVDMTPSNVIFCYISYVHNYIFIYILLADSHPKGTVVTIMMQPKNTKIEVRSSGGYTDYFDIVAGVLQGDTFTPYLFIICLDCVLVNSIDLMKENGFKLVKEMKQKIPRTNYYGRGLRWANQVESLLHSRERAAGSNADKTDYMCFNQSGDISTLKGGPLKLVDKFTYLGSSVPSTENDINTRLAKAWTAIKRLSVTWKSTLTDKIKRSFFQAAVVLILLYGYTIWTLTKRMEKKAWRQLHKNSASHTE